MKLNTKYGKQKPVKFKFAKKNISIYLPDVEENFIQKDSEEKIPTTLPAQIKPSQNNVLLNKVSNTQDIIKEKIINFNNFVISKLVGKSCQDCNTDDIAVLQFTCLCSRSDYIRILNSSLEEKENLLNSNEVRCLNCHKKTNNLF